MKLLQRYLVVIFITIFLFSCNDIVDSDKNIKITEITYNYVKSDQENDVVMPLKLGNKWYYDVYVYDLDSSTYHIDSIEVIKEVNLNNEKWFEVRMPMFSNKNVFLTNTDVGLWLKCDDCNYKSFHLAKYPAISEIFVSGYIDARTIPNINENYSDSLVKLTIIKSIGNSTINVPYGNFDCLKYESRFKTDDGETSHVPFMIEHYALETGLIKMEEFYSQTRIARVFELRNNPSINYDDCLESSDIYTDDIPKNSTHIEKVKLINNTLKDIKVTNVVIVSESNTGVFTIPNSVVFPFEIKAGDFTYLNININPNQLSRFYGLLKVISTSGCFYEINLQGMTI